MKYIPRVPPIIEAYFFEDINHVPSMPLEIRRVPVSMQGVCKACNKPFNQHGFIDQSMICPNTYIMTTKDSFTINIMEKETFESIYSPLDIEEGNWKDIKKN